MTTVSSVYDIKTILQIYMPFRSKTLLKRKSLSEIMFFFNFVALQRKKKRMSRDATEQMSCHGSSIQKLASDDNVTQKMASGDTDTQHMSPDGANMQELASNDTYTQKMAPDDSDTQKMAPDDSDTQKMTSGDTDIQKIASGDIKAQTIAPDDTDTQKMTPDDTDTQKMVSDDTDIQKMAPGDTKAQTMTSVVTDTQNMTPDDTDTQKMTPDDTDTQKMASDDTDIQKMAPGDTKAQTMTSEDTDTQKMVPDDIKAQTMPSDDTDTQKMASDDTDIQKMASGDTKTQTMTSDDTDTQKMVPDETNTQKMASDGTGVQKINSTDTNMSQTTSILDDTCKQKMLDDTDVEKKPSTDDMQSMLSNDTVEHNIRSDDTDLEAENVNTSTTATVPADTNIQILGISLDEFQELKNQRFQHLQQKTRKQLFDEISAFHSDPDGPYKYPPKLAEKTADRWLDPNFIPSWNDGGSDDEDNPEFTAAGASLEQQRKQWLATGKEQMLLLRFPLPPRMLPRAKVPLTLEQDNESRLLQNEEFVKEYCVNARLAVYHAGIEHLNQLRHQVNQFLWQQCRNTYLATIVFNGHGSCTRADDNTRVGTLSIHRSGKVTCNEIINIVHASFDNRDNINPQAVDVIFAQCYGHKFSRTDQSDSRIKIIPLTSDKKPKTQTGVKLCEQGVQVMVAYHACLECCASDRLKEAAQGSSDEPQQESPPSTSIGDVVDPTTETALDTEFLLSFINVANTYQDRTPTLPSDASEVNMSLTETPQASTTEMETRSAITENIGTGHTEQNMTRPTDDPSMASSSGFFSMNSQSESSLQQPSSLHTFRSATSSYGSLYDETADGLPQSTSTPTLGSSNTSHGQGLTGDGIGRNLPQSTSSAIMSSINISHGLLDDATTLSQPQGTSTQTMDSSDTPHGLIDDATNRNQSEGTNTPTSSSSDMPHDSLDKTTAPGQPQGTSAPTVGSGNKSHDLVDDATARNLPQSTTPTSGINNTSHGLLHDATNRNQPQGTSTPTVGSGNASHSLLDGATNRSQPQCSSTPIPDTGIAHNLPQSISSPAFGSRNTSHGSLDNAAALELQHSSSAPTLASENTPVLNRSSNSFVASIRDVFSNLYNNMENGIYGAVTEQYSYLQ